MSHRSPDDRAPIGQRLDALGIKSSLGDDELISAAMVIMKVVDEDGDPFLSVAWSDHVDFVTRRGMLEQACDIERQRLGALTTDD